MKIAVLLLGLFSLVYGQSTPVSQCIYQAGSVPINTFIEGCETTPCQFPQLQFAVLNIIFRAPHTIRSMRTLATAYILGPIFINYDLGEDAITCNFLTNTYCPLLAGEVVQYTLRMYIESYFTAGISVTIEFRIVDENNVAIMCIRLPVTILDPVSKTAGVQTIEIDPALGNSTVIVH